MAQLIGHLATMRELGCEFDSGWTNTQGLKISEKVLPL